MTGARSACRLFVMGAAAVIAAALPSPSRAATHVEASIQIEPAARVSRRLDVDVWTNKEEGGVYRQGEPMRVFFRSSADAFVLIYNIDTEGTIHLVYPYQPNDPDRVEGGRTYQVPSRNDPYDLVADGPTGIEYVVAIASPFPFEDLPWYLTPGYEGEPPDRGDDDYEDSGVIVGDPYVGMDRVVRRVVPDGREDDVATTDTYFYIERKVDYPRYVCADCHSYGGWYDPYVDVCSVVDIRIDATWARYRPLRSRLLRPRFFYMVRSTAPNRYRQWKDRWSSVDGRTTLRTRFQVDGQDKFRSRRELIQRRTPPEFRDLRRARTGRTWIAPDQVLRRRNQNDAVERDRRERELQESRRRGGEQRQFYERRQDQQRQERQMRGRSEEGDRGSRDRGDARRGDDRRQERERAVRERDNRDRDSQGDRGRGKEEQPRDNGDRGKGKEDRRRDDNGDRGRGSDNRHRDDGDQGRGRGHDRGR